MNGFRTIGTRVATVVWISGLLVVLGLWWAFRDPAVAAHVPLWLARLARRFGHGEADEVLRTGRVDAFWMRVALTRAAMVLTAAWAAFVALLHWRDVRRRVVDLLTEARHPVDLAIFRIVVFSQIYLVTPIPFLKIVTSLPHELQFPPETGIPRLGPLRAFAYWPVHPFTSDQVGFWCGVLKAACITGVLGLGSRTSAAVASVLFFWAWGAYQWYGKVDHHHHLLWFALILAVSRSGDALSLDALWAARRRADRGVTAPPGASPAYGAPLAVCMLLMGVIYLFPGAWKLTTSGLDWALSANPQNTMYMKWHMIGGWMPIVRIDRYPVLYQGGALAVLLFEVSFVFLVLLGPTTRMLAACYGIAFHLMTQLTMQISFWSLRNCYVIFFDWRRILAWAGRRLFAGPLVVAFDDRCRQCRRAVAILRVLDLLDAVCFERALAGPAHATVRATRGGRSWTGFDAYRAVAWRLPLLWPVLPLAYLPPVAWIDRRFAATAGHATTDAVLVPAPATPGGVPVGVVVVGALLLVGNVWTGALAKMDAWPLACYPMFNGIVGGAYETLQLQVVSPDGSERLLRADDYRDVAGYGWNDMLSRILQSPDGPRRQAQLRAVWRLMAERDPTLGHGELVRFVSVQTWLAPERWNDAPGPRRVIFEFRP